VEARGAGKDGNGGFVEISGKQNLTFEGKVNVAAPLGRLGTVLFDPRDLYIVDTIDPAIGADNSNQLNVNVPNPGNPLGSILFEDGGVDTDFQITKIALEGITGNIFLQASRDINLGTSLVFGNQPGRNIEFVAERNFNGTGNITAPGQNISIKASGLAGIQIGGINTISQSPDGKTNAAQGGAIGLNAVNGSITVGTIQSQSQVCDSANACTVGHKKADGPFASPADGPFSSAAGGEITLSAAGDIKAGDISSYSESFHGATGKGGNVKLTSRSGTVVVSSIGAFSLADGGISGEGGAIKIEGPKGITIIGNLDAQSSSWATGSKALSGGTVELSSNGDIQVSKIGTESVVLNGGKADDGGSISLAAGGSILIKENPSGPKTLNSRSEVRGDGIAGNGGAISLTSDNGEINAIGFDIFASSLLAGNGTTKRGGAIMLNANKNIATNNLYSLSQLVGNGATNDGGSISLNANGDITTNSLNSPSQVLGDGTVGNGGTVLLKAGGEIKTGGISTFSEVTSPNNNPAIGGTGKSGTGGNITIIGEKIIATGALQSFSEVKRDGQSGDGGAISLESASSLKTDGLISSSRACYDLTCTKLVDSKSGNGGPIMIASQDDIKASRLIAFSASPGASGNAGAVDLSSKTGSIKVVSVDAFSGPGIKPSGFNKANDAGSVTLTAFNGSIEVAEKINSFADGAISSGSGKDIILKAGGDIIIEPSQDPTNSHGLFSFSNSDSDIVSTRKAGNILLSSSRGSINISDGQISAGADGPSDAPIKSGNVTISAKNNIKTGLIYNILKGGQGGTIKVSTQGLFQSTDIRTGNVQIFHGGGLRGKPFTVGAGASTENGVSGSIMTQKKETLGVEKPISITGSYMSPEKSIKILTNDPLLEVEKIINFNKPEPPPSPPASLVLPSEQALTQEMDSYLNGSNSDKPKTHVKTLKEIKEDLQRISSQTNGMNVALVYITCDEKNSKGECTTSMTVDVITAGIDPKQPRLRHKILYSDAISLAQRFSKRIKISSSSEDKSYPINYPLIERSHEKTFIKYSDPENESQKLYDLIIRPFEKVLLTDKINHIAFITERGLRTIPYSALHDGSQFLMEKYSVGLMPSFSYLDMSYYKGIQDSSILAMGTNDFPPGPYSLHVPEIKKFNVENRMKLVSIRKYDTPLPEFNVDNVDWTELKEPSNLWMKSYNPAIYEDEELQMIPSIEEDLKTLAWANKSKDKNLSNRVFLGKEFTLKSLQTQRDQSRIIHLSTHAEYRNGPKENSFIYFRGDDEDNKIVGNKVTLADVPEAKLSLPPEVELVFLAACQTAEGGDGSAELGFSGAFIQAQVKSVIASLWKVRYRETYAFSMEFYNQLRHGAESGLGQNTKAAAIQRTQKALREGKVYIDEDRNLHLSFDKTIPLPLSFPASKNEKIKFTEPGDWAGLTIIGSPW
jgi:CHAT domain-containing protein